MKHTRALAVMSAILFGCGTMGFADDVAEIEKKIVAAWTKVKSYSAKHKSTSDYAYGEGHSEKTETLSASEYVFKGENVFFRMEMNTTTVKTENGKTTTEKSKMLMVGNAEFTWTLSESDGKKTVMKMEAHKAALYSPTHYFNAYRDGYTTKSLADAKFDGADCYVLEVKAKPKEGQPPSGPFVMYYRKDCGMSVKSVTYDADGKVTMESLTTDLKLNPSINDERFEFTVPEGVEVTDATPEGQKKMMEQMQADQAAQEQEREKEAEAKKAEQAKKDEPAKKKEPAKKPEEKKKKKKKLKLPKIKFP